MKKILETVLVAINGSDASICAFKNALALKKAFGTRIVACYVVDTATIRQLALADAIILGGAPADALYRDAIADSNHEVLKNARCPVLFVKPPLGEEFYKSM
jgi:nucleotide-binding universal stress UspA family protein